MLRDFGNLDLSSLMGLIHIGANIGEERREYAQYDLNVLWFEPNPESFQKLQFNIREFPKQQALQYLILDEDDKQYTFHVADNGAGVAGASSILERTGHKEAWPSVSYVKEIEVSGLTLNTFFTRNKIDKSQYQFLSVDTEGTELLVLKGATEILPFIRFVEVEVMDFDVYSGGSSMNDIDIFMESAGFKKKGLCLQCVAEVGQGRCYNALYYRP
jgi:FkbM family methyltransferase